MSSSKPAAATARLYRGVSAADRRAGRRERFIAAGLELFGTQGYAVTSIRSISAEASLNSRYFYESFSDREDLLFHVYGHVVGEIGSAVLQTTAVADSIAEQARAGLRTAWSMLTDDPRRARIVAVEVVGISPRLERVRRETRHAFADLLVRNAMSMAADGIELRMDPVLVSRSLMGAVMELLGDWINGDVEANVEEIVEHFTRMFTAVALAAVARPGEPANRAEDE